VLQPSDDEDNDDTDEINDVPDTDASYDCTATDCPRLSLVELTDMEDIGAIEVYAHLVYFETSRVLFSRDFDQSVFDLEQVTDDETHKRSLSF